jgi:hypothetical protein
MKRLMSILSACALVTLLLAALVTPAMADDNGRFFFGNDFDDDHHHGFFFDDDNDHHFFNDDNNFDDNDFDDDFFNDIGQESESGDVNITSDVSSEGDFASQCVAPLQFGNTANLQNGQAFSQFDSDADDIEFDGSEFGFFTGPGSGVDTTCEQAVQQSSAASS